ncbi:protein transport protein S31 [Tulasnella sp. 425]|nr:protein transport protein S31 [Tulasnella sp. 425]
MGQRDDDIAAGMENGKSSLWGAAKIIENAEGDMDEAMLLDNGSDLFPVAGRQPHSSDGNTNHTGPVRALDSNNSQTHTLSSGTVSPELYIQDLSDALEDPQVRCDPPLLDPAWLLGETFPTMNKRYFCSASCSNECLDIVLVLLKAPAGYQALRAGTSGLRNGKRTHYPPQIRLMWSIVQNRSLHNAFEAKRQAIDASYNFKAESMFPANRRRKERCTPGSMFGKGILYFGDVFQS